MRRLGSAICLSLILLPIPLLQQSGNFLGTKISIFETLDTCLRGSFSSGNVIVSPIFVASWLYVVGAGLTFFFKYSRFALSAGFISMFVLLWQYSISGASLLLPTYTEVTPISLSLGILVALIGLILCFSQDMALGYASLRQNTHLQKR
jgi:hypothetical protein